MRIYMQIPPVDGQTPRFYHLFLQADLLEGWSLVKEWGQQGSPGRLQRQHFTTREAAEAALRKARDDQSRRGYRVVFARGEEQP